MKELNYLNYKELLPYIKKANYPDYNSNIYTMMMWESGWQMYYEIFENYAFVGFYLDDHMHYFLPYCDKQYFEEAIEFLRKRAIEQDTKLTISSFDDEIKDWFNLKYPNQGYFNYYEDGNAYIYDRKQQETLKGKKMQKRRNHFNAFLKEYENRYEYKPLCKELVPDILECLKRWQENKGMCDSIEEEEDGIRYLLKHIDEFELFGGCIYIDDQLEAFNICTLTTDNMMQINIEKANKNIRGLYVAILKLFLETLDESITLINLEDDMGLESLRKAKKDMKPVLIQRKFSFTFDKIEIKHPSNFEVRQMMDLWLERFDDEDRDTTNFYFNEIYQKPYAYIIRNSKEIMGMAFFHPWQMRIHDERKTVLFLEGVCVRKIYTHCGVMDKLLKYMFNEVEEYEIALQAYDWDLYKPYGFEVTHTLTSTKMDASYTFTDGTFEECSDASILYYLYENYVSNKDGYRIRDLSYYYHFYIPYASICNEKIYVYTEDEDILGYVKMSMENDTLYVSEIIYEDQEILNHMLGCLYDKHSNIEVIHDNACKVNGISTSINTLMMLHERNLSNTYLNEIL